MDAKLYKVENTFYLKVGGTILGTSSNPNLSASIRYSLSLKNCQAIELGYDLAELARENNKHHKRLGTVIDKLPLLTAALRQGYTEGYKEGFQKALEILGDKKFSEDDMIMFGLFCRNNHVGECLSVNDELFPKYQSLQQTEWDVWLVMACGLPDGCTEPEVTCTCDIIPSLDTDGCIILKRK